MKINKILFLTVVLFLSATVFSDFLAEVEYIDGAPNEGVEGIHDSSAVEDSMAANCDGIIEIDPDYGNFVLNGSIDGYCFKIIPGSGSGEFVFDCDGYTIKGDGVGDGKVGIYVAGADKVIIKNCKIEEIENAIIFHDSDNSKAQDNSIDTVRIGIFFGADSQTKVQGNTATKNTIKNFKNNVLRDGFGIIMYKSQGSLISKNKIEQGFLPIYMMAGKDNEVIDNTIDLCEFVGIGIRESDTITIEDNKISRTGTGGYGDGIGLLNSFDCEIKNNEISDVGTSGIALISNTNKKRNTVSNNDMSGDGICGITFGMDSVTSTNDKIRGMNYGICFADFDGNNLEKCVVDQIAISRTGTADVYVWTENVLLTNVLLDSAFDETDVDCEPSVDDSFLSIQERIIIKLIDSNEDPIANARLRLENGDGEIIFSNKATDSNGELDEEITTRGVYEFERGNAYYEDYSEHEITVDFGGSSYEMDFEITKSGTYIIKMEDISQYDKKEIGGTCTTDFECESGFCCKQGVYSGTCRASSAQCPNYECIENAHCAETKYCLNNKCVNVPTGDCGEIVDHAWVDFECCDDDECAVDEKCEDNGCVKITGDCGHVENHTWVEYECCENADCLGTEKCVNNVCESITGVDGYAENHTWVYYECTKNSDCAADEKCSAHDCIKIQQGTCGEIVDHAWVDFECCSDGDCSENQFCNENNECQDKMCCGIVFVLGILGVGMFVVSKKY